MDNNPQIDFLIKRLSELFNNISTQIQQIQQIQDKLITDNQKFITEISNLKTEINVLKHVINRVKTDIHLNDEQPHFANIK